MKSLNDRNKLFTAFTFKACFTCKDTDKTKLFAQQKVKTKTFVKKLHCTF